MFDATLREMMLDERDIKGRIFDLESAKRRAGNTPRFTKNPFTNSINKEKQKLKTVRQNIRNRISILKRKT